MKSAQIIQKVQELIERIRSVDLVIPEDSGSFSIEDELVRHVDDLLDEALLLLTDVGEFYERQQDEDDAAALGEGSDFGEAADFLREIGAQISSQLAAQEVSGLAFVGRSQLKEIRDGLQVARRERIVWKIASYVDTGIRRAGKALVALESAILEYEDLPPNHRSWEDIGTALQIRRIYGQFQRAVLRGGDLEPEQIPQRLRSAANRIAILRGLEIYPYLRIDDRLQIRRLQKRILDWLGAGKKGVEPPEDGLRLWQDLAAFARLLGQVNHRQELREHDRAAVRDIYRDLFEIGETSDRLLPEHLALLEPLLGRDEEVDDILLHPERHATHELEQPLLRLRRELEQPFTTSAGTEGFGTTLGHPVGS